MDLDIGENLKIVNASKLYIEEMKRNNDTLENGAVQVLAGLEEFIETMLDKYESNIPYEMVFSALKQIISSALEKEEVLYAVMSGLITEKKTVKHTEIHKAEPVKVNKVSKVTKKYNISAIKLYAKTHTVKEIVEHFGFSNERNCRKYVAYHGISYKAETKNNPTYESQVTELAKSMTLTELARVFGRTKNAMIMYCKRHNIRYLNRKE